MANEALTALATAGVTLAKDAALAVLGSLVVYAVAVWGTKKVYRLVSGAPLAIDLPEADESFMRQEMARSRGDADSDGDIWGRDGGPAETGFFPELDHGDFADTQPLRRSGPGYSPDDIDFDDFAISMREWEEEYGH